MRFKKKHLNRVVTIILIFSAALIFQNCTSAKLTVPAVVQQPTGKYLYGKFVWRDLLTYDVSAVKKFYGELFGWTFADGSAASSDYTTILKDGTPIGGIVFVEDIREKGYSAQWMSYLSVPDVDKSVALFKKEGGKVTREPKNINGRGRMAIVQDPQGALIALLHSAVGDPLDEEPQVYEWLWEENLTTDVEAAVSFYQALVGYDSEELKDIQISGTTWHYYVMNKDGYARAGITQLPWKGVRPNWLPYIKVDAPQPLMSKVEKLGGKVYLPPNKDIRQGSVAFIADPTGAVLALQKWPINQP
ncbi:MAG TPA: VOC family protein [Caldithrix abyssi]|uniref:VOC family protein n=1 Tax=Caldithrix abyssi TaxID=187145 RepID=A0A7V4TYE6_CALAY|nr:VOC family protein [Caldithrix abyssi]